MSLSFTGQRSIISGVQQGSGGILGWRIENEQAPSFLAAADLADQRNFGDQSARLSAVFARWPCRDNVALGPQLPVGRATMLHYCLLKADVDRSRESCLRAKSAMGDDRGTERSENKKHAGLLPGWPTTAGPTTCAHIDHGRRTCTHGTNHICHPLRCPWRRVCPEDDRRQSAGTWRGRNPDRA